MAKRKRTAFQTKAERDAWDAHVDETLRRGRELVTKGLAELERKRRQAAG